MLIALGVVVWIVLAASALRGARAFALQRTLMSCVPTNSASTAGSPSSSSMAVTSLRLAFSSSRDSAWLWAQGKPRTNPTYRLVSWLRSTTAV